MKSTEIVVSKKLVYGIGIVLITLAALTLFGGKFSAFDFGRSQNSAGTGTAPADSINLAAGSTEKFAFLSGKGEKRSVGST